ncbi:MAG: putative toxin-antitoxin system toxin component, PIN family [Bacteroidales bacterium]|nr:putative toxin-antitoxin system toxin component, PIN family [Bacteroidales bacterium]
MKIVLDTNCLLQILGAKSKYAFLFDKYLQGEYTLCVSSDILLEYEEILKAKASPVAADLFMKVITRSRNIIRKDPYFRLGIIKQDNDDNKFTDCAFACGADVIVTNDSHFDEAKESPFPTFHVINLEDFAKLLQNGSRLF